MSDRPRFPRPARARSRGFTLLELTIVMALVGIVVAFAVPSLSGGGKRSVLLSTAEEIGARIAGARELAIARNRCVLVHVHTTQKRNLEVAILKTDDTSTVDCEKAAAQGAQSIGINWDGAQTLLSEVKELDLELPVAKHMEMSVTVSNSQPVLVFRPNGWVRGNNYGTSTSTSISDDDWTLTLTDKTLTQGKNVFVTVKPWGLVCVNQNGVCP
ncbi:MAG: prepilin-type N-terminal cleavage/methylation domain-containing protein [Myxococcota bacterium]